VLALTTRAKANLVRRAGAHTVLDRDADDAAGALARAAPHGVDGVADVIGGDPVTALLPTVRDGGRWIVAGALAGAVVSLDLRRLYLHNIRLIGSSMHTPAHFARLAEAARRGTVAPRIAGRYALSEIHAAQRGFQTRTHVGKVVILP
jgi:NADPH:quinone reductase-like Zn-dependent oxidoreductase